jgi:hypothetical protein
VLDHLADLEADFLVFYRLDPEEVLEMSGPRFFSLAHRSGAYDGAVAARMAAQSSEQPGRSPGPGKADKHVESTQSAIRADPALAGIIEF